MTECERQPRREGRKLASEIHHIQSAAVAEALALGHPEVDVDHLLLGLLTVGGPSAEALAGAGADVQAVRRAVVETQAHDLHPLGVTVTPRPAVLRAADRLDELAVPVNGRAHDLLHSASQRADDRGLLLALLDDEGQRARRLLEHVGVELTELHDRVRRVRDVTGAALAVTEGQDHGVLRGPPPAGATWMEASYCQVLPIPAHRVWALVSDPSRRTEWDPTCTAVTVTSEGLEQLTQVDGHPLIQEVIQCEPGRAIAWREHDGISAATGAGLVLQLVLVPSGNLTCVTLYRSWPARGVGVRLARPLLVRMARAQLRVRAHGIAQTA